MNEAQQPAMIVEQLKRNGWWNEPEITDEIAEAFRWWNKIEKWRSFKQTESGAMIPYRLEFRELLDFLSVYDSALDKEYLLEVVRAIDDEWLIQLNRKAVQSGAKQRMV